MHVLEPSPAAVCPVTPPKPWRGELLALVTARRASSLARHVLLVWPLAALPSLALVGAAYGLVLGLGVDPAFFAPPALQPTLEQFFGMVIFAPLVETLLLGGLLWLLARLSSRPLFIAAASGLLWGGLHGSMGLLWFFGTFWGFYVLSCAYLAWRPLGFGRAFAAAALPHALVNLTVFAAILLDL